ncbi:4'-phosphopantetheinyl transferase superfamily [Umbelopsis sp. PMI_123]|nr:4'-phosphopantetheinyl transferase superfamily [Umbelopsis sp. PMI_123]
MLSFVFLAVNVAQWSSKELDLGLQYLPTSERSRILRFRLKADQYRSLASQLLKRYLVSKHLNVAWDEITFKESEFGKPSLAINTMDNIDFNVSHHGEWVVIAACSNGKIGIDVTRNELPSERIDAFIECFADQLTDDELVKLHNANDDSQKLQLFYEIWCLKESYIKALGTVAIQTYEISYLNKNAEKMDPKVIVHDSKEPANDKAYLFNLSYIDKEHPVAICTNAKLNGTEKILSESSLKMGSTQADIEKNGSLFSIITFNQIVQGS